MAECLEGLAAIAIASGGYARAAELLAAATALREAIGAPLSPADGANYERMMASLRGALGGEHFHAVWNHKAAKPPEHAVQTAIDDAMR